MNMALWVHQSSPNFDGLRQSSHEGARMLPVHPETCLISGGTGAVSGRKRAVSNGLIAKYIAAKYIAALTPPDLKKHVLANLQFKST